MHACVCACVRARRALFVLFQQQSHNKKITVFVATFFLPRSTFPPIFRAAASTFNNVRQNQRFQRHEPDLARNFRRHTSLFCRPTSAHRRWKQSDGDDKQHHRHSGLQQGRVQRNVIPACVNCGGGVGGVIAREPSTPPPQSIAWGHRCQASSRGSCQRCNVCSYCLINPCKRTPTLPGSSTTQLSRPPPPFAAVKSSSHVVIIASGCCVSPSHQHSNDAYTYMLDKQGGCNIFS